MASSLNVCKVAAAQFVEEREEDVRHHHNNWRQKISAWLGVLSTQALQKLAYHTIEHR